MLIFANSKITRKRIQLNLFQRALFAQFNEYREEAIVCHEFNWRVKYSSNLFIFHKTYLDWIVIILDFRSFLKGLFIFISISLINVIRFWPAFPRVGAMRWCWSISIFPRCKRWFLVLETIMHGLTYLERYRLKVLLLINHLMRYLLRMACRGMIISLFLWGLALYLPMIEICHFNNKYMSKIKFLKRLFINRKFSNQTIKWR